MVPNCFWMPFHGKQANFLHCLFVSAPLHNCWGFGVADLLVESLHGQKPSLSLLGLLLGCARTGQGFAVQGAEAGLGPEKARHEEVK